MKAKQLFTFLCIMLSSGLLRAQYITLPDTNFVNWLNNNGYGQCLLGNQLDTTCPAVLSVNYFKCVGGNIHSFEGLQYFKNADTLWLTNDSVTSLPPLPSKLHLLLVRQTLVSTLPTLPDSLTNLYCQNNMISVLPQLPTNLTILDCEINIITVLPQLPNSLTQLICGSNQLITLPELPDSLGVLLCNEQPTLRCLPWLKTITSLNFSNTSVLCVPNYGNVAASGPPLNSLPLCDSINPNNCPLYNSITDIKPFSFSLSPNPSNNMLSIQLSDEPKTALNISIYDISGRLLQKLQPSQQSKFDIDIKGLKDGMYLIEIQTENGFAVQKFIKQ